MAIPKTKTEQNLITVALTDEERDILQTFADEQDIMNLERAIPAMIHELVRLHDQLWDAQFAHSTAPLDAKAREALEEDSAGLTEDFDTNIP